LLIARPPLSPLFPYTTLFRSERLDGDVERAGDQHRGVAELAVAAHPPHRVGERAGQQQVAEVLDRVLSQLLDRSAFVAAVERPQDRKSTRLNSSHVKMSYAVF